MSSAAFLLALGLAVSTARAPSDLTVTDAVKDSPTLATMVVTGTMPGPGLWQVRKEDHTLWLLGTVNPLPKDMQWDSSDVDELVAEADEVLAPGGVQTRLGAGSKFKLMLLAPKVVSALKNADGKHLNDVLPADIYARWAELKGKYLANDRKVERYRPEFASAELYNGAITHSNLSRAPVVWKHVAAFAKQHRVPVTDTAYRFTYGIDRKKVRAGLQAVNTVASAEVACLGQSLDTLESDLEAMKRTANAWATGDVALLRELRLKHVRPDCESALGDALSDAALGFMEQQRLEQEASNLWLSKAEIALARNRSTVAVLGMHSLLSADGLLAKLRARGYEVIEPDAELEDVGRDLDAADHGEHAALD
jgi:uncharacterized protein YbaP (TraB family)